MNANKTLFGQKELMMNTYIDSGLKCTVILIVLRIRKSVIMGVDGILDNIVVVIIIHRIIPPNVNLKVLSQKKENSKKNRVIYFF